MPGCLPALETIYAMPPGSFYFGFVLHFDRCGRYMSLLLCASCARIGSNERIRLLSLT